MMPVEIGWAATVMWTAGDVLCRVCAFFKIFGLFLSGNILICISLDRYTSVCTEPSENVCTYLGRIYNNRHHITATIGQTLGPVTGAMGCESCDDRQKEAKIGRRTKGREAFSRPDGRPHRDCIVRGGGRGIMIVLECTEPE